MQLLSPAKINLTLDIFQPDTSGYHPLYSIFQRTSLCDLVNIKKNDSNTLQFSCSNEKLEREETTVHKAYKFLCDHINETLGIDVELTKNIPMQSGLGGGSSNAASFLLGVNELFELNLSKEILKSIGKKIGMDVPFFIEETSTALAEGYGEHITPLPTLPEYGVLICMGDISISTPEAYKNIDSYSIGQEKEKTEQLQKMLVKKNVNLESLHSLLHNDFESYLWKSYPQLVHYRQKIAQICNIAEHTIHITGSGAAMYVLFDTKDNEQYKKKAQTLRNEGIWAVGGNCE